MTTQTLTTLTIDADGKVALPRELMEQLGVRPGDQLDASLNGATALVMRHGDWVNATRGMFKGVWQGLDAQDYVNAERAAWSD